MRQKVYEIGEREYVTHYHEIDNIEDAGEDFITSAELEDAGNKHGRSVWKMDLIRERVVTAAKTIPKNKMSAPLDKELAEAVNLGMGYAYDDELAKVGWRIQNGRVYNKPVTRRNKICKPDFISFRHRVNSILSDRGLDITFCINHGQCKQALVEHWKKVVTWKELAAEDHYSYDNKYSDGLKRIRKIWLDPTLVKKL